MERLLIFVERLLILIAQIFGLCKKIIFLEASHLFEPISCGIGIFILTLHPEIRK